ncbi:cyanophycinase [Soehngenia longivitae]|uniref:Cyanophycinase n=1 Tax=Soehngenia longivitae TaxID=2562294 RepID=A0A4Z0D9Z0_9FIRM|nr:cyanophycinase [Soehngenia longivitae]TFZ41721.1 cyanophycinase [Soehngenia longivitae]
MNGKLIIAGGNLEESEYKIHEYFIKSSYKPGKKIAIIPTASGIEPIETIEHVKAIWVNLGVEKEDIIIIPIYGDEGGLWRDPPLGDSDEIVDIIKDINGFWFTGGDQFYIHKAFIRKNGDDTKALLKIKENYEAGGIIGGTSAGAAIMSKIMIGSGDNSDVLKGRIKYGYDDYDETNDDYMRIVRGLGFFEWGVVDQHFDKRARILRLARAVLEPSNKTLLGFGVSEDTALIYDKEAETLEVLGSGAVFILDMNQANNFKTDEVFSFEKMNISILREKDYKKLPL